MSSEKMTRIREIIREVKRGVDAARDMGIVCGYPPWIEIDGEIYPFDEEAIDAK